MVRAVSVDKNGLKKGTWSQEEDDKLRAYVMRYGHWNWRQLPKLAGLLRCGKSCRLRWLNYLRPDIKRGNFSKEEDDLIIQLHQELGNKWSKIAMNLPGRTDNEIKNHWHTRLKKRVMLIQTTRKQNPEKEVANNSIKELEAGSLIKLNEVSDSSSVVAGDWVAESSVPSKGGVLVDSGADFWTQPFIGDDYIYPQDDCIFSHHSCYCGDSMDLIYYAI